MQSYLNTIKEQLKQGAHAMKSARALYDGYNTTDNVVRKQILPKYLQDVVNFSRRSDLTKNDVIALKKLVRKEFDRLAQNGVPNRALKTSYKELLDAVESCSDKALKRAIRTAVEEKSRYVAERIAITESARAWYQGFLKDTMDDPDVVAYRWVERVERVESTRHPTEDICDEYAKVDAYGLGTGIFPKDKVPVLPVHPNCMCRLRPVMTGSDLLQTEHAEDRGNKGGTDYLKKASAETRKKILGVKGAESFEMGKVEDWRTIARGYDEAYMTGRIVEGINTLEDKMRYNLIPPSDEFIAKLAEGQNKPYTLGVEKD